MWRWENSEPFGNNPPDENPSGLGTFEFNLRFPGQYADRETGLNYNYFRDYDPQTGRYVQSDPIGLRGGINTYAYALSTPVRKRDRFGLWSPGGHDRIYEFSIGDRLTGDELQHVQNAGRLYDRKTQGPDRAHLHALRRPGQSVAEMIELRDTAAEALLLQARDLALAGGRVP